MSCDVCEAPRASVSCSAAVSDDPPAGLYLNLVTFARRNFLYDLEVFARPWSRAASPFSDTHIRQYFTIPRYELVTPAHWTRSLNL